MQQHFADLFAGGRASRFAGDGDGKSVVAERSRQLFELRALAAAVETFKSNESSARRHVGDDSRPSRSPMTWRRPPYDDCHAMTAVVRRRPRALLSSFLRESFPRQSGL